MGFSNPSFTAPGRLLSRLGIVDASITLLSLLHQLTFGRLLSRLGIVDARITLLSLLHQLSAMLYHLVHGAVL